MAQTIRLFLIVEAASFVAARAPAGGRGAAAVMGR